MFCCSSTGNKGNTLLLNHSSSSNLLQDVCSKLRREISQMTELTSDSRQKLNYIRFSELVDQ